jgi:DNA-directed RNA polymerase specialized sigma24 family protein
MMAPEPGRERREALARFYAARHRILARAVARRARGLEDALVADACAYAWLKLVGRPDITLDRGGFMWLLVVATHEARRLDRPGPERPVGAFTGEPADAGELAEPAGLMDDPLGRVIALETHRERVTRFAGLRPRERRDLFLQAGGYRYDEIAAVSGVSRCRRRMPRGAVR